MKCITSLLLLTLSTFLSLIHSQTTVLMSSQTASPNSIGSNSEIRFTITINNINTFTIPAGGFLYFTYPTAFTRVSDPPTCQLAAIPSSTSTLSSTPACTVFAAGTIRIPSLLLVDTAYYSIQFIISGFKNPSQSDYSGTFSFYITNPSGTVTAQVIDTTKRVTLIWAKFNTCTLSQSTSDIVGTSTDVRLSLNSINGVPQNGVLRIQTPVWDSTASSSSLRYYAQTSVACEGISSNVAVTPTCAFDPTTGNITVTGAFASAAAAPGDIIILLKNLRTPLSTGPSANFLITSLTNTGTLLEYCNDMNFQVSTPGPIYGWLMSCQTTQILSSGYCDFRFQITNPIPSGGNIAITVPTEMSFSSVTLFGVETTAVDAFGNDVVSSVTPSISGRTINLNNIATSDVPRTTQIRVLLSPFTLPSSLAPTSSFTVTTSIGSYKIDETSTGLTFAATTGLHLTVNSVTAADTKAGVTTTYTFDITLTSSLTSTGGITIVFPSEFAISASCTLSNPSSNMNGSPQACTSDSTTRKITLSGVFTTLAVGQTISFTVSGIRNPQTTKPTSTLTISSLQSTSVSTSIVDQDSTYSVSFITANSLTPSLIILNPSSFTTSTRTLYTFGFTNNNPYPANGKVVLQIPKGAVTIDSFTDTQNSLTGLDSGATVVIQDTGTVYRITISSAFSSLYSSPTAFTFTLNGITNPPTTQMVTGIIFSTYTSDDYIIDTLSPGASLTMTTPHEFSFLQVTPETLENGGTGTYTLQITLDHAHYTGDRLTITFPTELILNVASVTIGVGTPPQISITSSQSSNSAVVILTTTDTSIPAGANIFLVVSSTKNNIYTSSIGSFTFTSQDSLFYYRSRSTLTDTSLVTEPATLPLPNTYVLPDNTVTNYASATYTFSIERVNSIGAGGKILVEFPAEIPAPTAATLQCSPIAGISGIGCSVSSNIVTITGTFVSNLLTLLQFTIHPITNPSLPTSGSFVITTETSTGTVVDKRDMDLRFNTACDSPCKECITGQRTTCTSCFTDGSSLLQYLYVDTCVDVCPTGFFPNVLGVCTACTSPCAECTGTATQCTKCEIATPQLYLSGTSCVDPCPAQFYKDDSFQVCSACINTCDTCENWNECLTCPVGLVLYQKRCINACPASITVEIAGVCYDCDSKCATCQTSTTNCPTCNDPYISYNNQCLDNCPSQMYKSPLTSACTPCVSPCVTCSSQTSCDSCISGRYLLGHDCEISCPSGYYQDIANRQCTQCPTNCQVCSSGTVCTQCESTVPPYYLSSGNCVLNCPTGSVPVGTNCVSCATGCSECTGTTTHCTVCSLGYKLTTSNTCDPNCPTGKYDTGLTCADCHTSCRGCSAAGASSCTSCQNGAYPFLTLSGTCSNTCPAAYYGNTNTNTCDGCNGRCASCFGGTSSECYTCNSPYLKYGTSCVATCPSNSIESGTSCLACSSNCLTCDTTTTNCASCNSGYILTEKADGTFYCLSDGTTPVEEEETTEETGTETESKGFFDSGLVPFPFLIGGLILVVSVLGAKAAVSETVVPGNLLALLSVVLYAAAVTFTVWILLKDYGLTLQLSLDYLPFLLFAGGLIMNYVNNLIHLILIFRLKKNDGNYRKWRETKKNRVISNTILVFSTLTTFKFNRLTYNKLLGYKYFSADMKSTDSLKPIYILTIWNMITSYFPYAGGAVYQLRNGFPYEQIYVISTEVIVLVVICSMLCFCDISRTKNFYKSDIEKVGTETSFHGDNTANRRGNEKYDNDVSRSKLGLLEDESRIDVGGDQESSFMHGTDNLKTPGHENKKITNPKLLDSAIKKLNQENILSPLNEEQYSFRAQGTTANKKLLDNGEDRDYKLSPGRTSEINLLGNGKKNKIFPTSKLNEYTITSTSKLDLLKDTDRIMDSAKRLSHRDKVEGERSDRDYGEDEMPSSARKQTQGIFQKRPLRHNESEGVFEFDKKQRSTIDSTLRLNTEGSRGGSRGNKKRVEFEDKDRFHSLPDSDGIENIAGVPNRKVSRNSSGGSMSHFRLDGDEPGNSGKDGKRNLSDKNRSQQDFGEDETGGLVLSPADRVKEMINEGNRKIGDQNGKRNQGRKGSEEFESQKLLEDLPSGKNAKIDSAGVEKRTPNGAKLLDELEEIVQKNKSSGEGRTVSDILQAGEDVESGKMKEDLEKLVQSNKLSNKNQEERSQQNPGSLNQTKPDIIDVKDRLSSKMKEDLDELVLDNDKKQQERENESRGKGDLDKKKTIESTQNNYIDKRDQYSQPNSNNESPEKQALTKGSHENSPQDLRSMKMSEGQEERGRGREQSQQREKTTPNATATYDRLTTPQKQFRTHGNESKNQGNNKHENRRTSVESIYPHESVSNAGLESHVSNGTFNDIRPYPSDGERFDPASDFKTNSTHKQNYPQKQNLVGQQDDKRGYLPSLQNKNGSQKTEDVLNKFKNKTKKIEKPQTERNPSNPTEEEKNTEVSSVSQRRGFMEDDGLSDPSPDKNVQRNNALKNPNNKNAKHRSISHRNPRSDKKKNGQEKKDDIDFSNDSQVSISDMDNFVNEDTPSNYNMLNQRFDADSRYSYTTHNGKYSREISIPEYGSPLHPDSLQRKYLPNLNSHPQADDKIGGTQPSVERWRASIRSNAGKNAPTSQFGNGQRSKSEKKKDGGDGDGVTKNGKFLPRLKNLKK